MADDTAKTDTAQPTAVDAAFTAAWPLDAVAPEKAVPLPPGPAQGAQCGGDSLPDHAENGFSDHDKAFFRANIRWIMAELDLARSGLTAGEREAMNP